MGVDALFCPAVMSEAMSDSDVALESVYRESDVSMPSGTDSDSDVPETEERDDTPEEGEKQARRTYTVAFKLKVIQKAEDTSQYKAGQMYKLSKGMVCKWVADKAKLQAAVRAGGKKN